MDFYYPIFIIFFLSHTFARRDHSDFLDFCVRVDGLNRTSQTPAFTIEGGSYEFESGEENKLEAMGQEVLSRFDAEFATFAS